MDMSSRYSQFFVHESEGHDEARHENVCLNL